MKYRVLAVAALGVALTVYLVKFVGFTAVYAAATAVGWRGFALLCSYAAALFPLLGAAWYVLLPAESHSYFGLTVWARMVRDAAAEVLPFSQFGAIGLGARAATLHGMPAPLAFGSMLADITTELFAQIAYAALGVAILITWTPRNAGTPAHTSAFVTGLVLAAAGGGVFLFLQLKGRRFTEKIAEGILRSWPSGASRPAEQAAQTGCCGLDAARPRAGRLLGGTPAPRPSGHRPRAAAATKALGSTLDSVYRSRARVALSATLHLAAWLASAFGAWIAFRLIGASARLPAVLAIESLVYAARSAAAVVPNALGVQEAAYAALAPIFGIGADFGLAVSLIKRARDIAIGIPVLLVWQAVEGRRALAERTG